MRRNTPSLIIVLWSLLAMTFQPLHGQDTLAKDTLGTQVDSITLQKTTGLLLQMDSMKTVTEADQR